MVYGVTSIFGDGALGPVLIALAGIVMVVLAFARRIRQGSPVPAG
jgi:hypothetical protein